MKYNRVLGRHIFSTEYASEGNLAQTALINRSGNNIQTVILLDEASMTGLYALLKARYKKRRLQILMQLVLERINLVMSTHQRWFRYP
jgi:hypothetical protein